MATLPAETSLHIAVAAVRSASAATRRVQQTLRSADSMTKSDRSPVTVADFAAQAIIASALMSDCPDIPLVGEESADALREPDGAELRRSVCDRVKEVLSEPISDEDILDCIDHGNGETGERFWTLDPVDGTKGFMRGDQYAVSLGLVENGVVTVGVLGCPNLARLPADSNSADGVIFAAALNAGSFALPLPFDDPDETDYAVPLTAKQSESGQIRICESVEKSHSSHEVTAAIVDHLGLKSTPVRIDSQCKYGVVARGEADAYFRLPRSRSYREKIWDHAAGAIVATEAGAIVTDVYGQPLDFSQGEELLENQGIICAAPEVHTRLTNALAELNLLP